MPSLAYYSLAEAFFKFQRIAEKERFYLDEVHRMAESLKEMNPVPELDPKEVADSMKGGATV